VRNIRGIQISFFSFSVYQNLTREMYIMMGMFTRVQWTERKIKHMNQLEIAQNETWTPQKFSPCTVRIASQ